jgi:hypothetical protein
VRVLPEAVGLARTRFFPSRTPARNASSCGGYSSVIPDLIITCFMDSGIGSFSIFKACALF